MRAGNCQQGTRDCVKRACVCAEGFARRLEPRRRRKGEVLDIYRTHTVLGKTDLLHRLTFSRLRMVLHCLSTTLPRPLPPLLSHRLVTIAMRYKGCLYPHAEADRAQVERRWAQQVGQLSQDLNFLEVLLAAKYDDHASITDEKELASFNKVEDGVIAVPGSCRAPRLPLSLEKQADLGHEM